jgi:Tfp pilus assembly protein PilZ
MNRRKNRRVVVDLPVHFSVNYEARVKNISMNGLKLAAHKLLIKGTILFMILHLPGEDLKVIGEVRWSKSAIPGEYENGVEFFFMNSTYQERIRDFIEEQMHQHVMERMNITKNMTHS